MWYIINKFILLKNILFHRKVEKINHLIIDGNMQATKEYDMADGNAVIIA